ncbi:hypothetical protein [Lacipirellula sp.]|uniref:hypothetical protein n=1 Tax=Lacipirellula sp. TaxID=2691419 RepID=UPI003D13DFCC
MSELAAVCCYFNPCRYAARRRNYDAFRRRIERSGVSLLTIELLFGEDDKSELGGHGDVITLLGGDVMWQKERLLQHGIDMLIEDGQTAVAWLDADIVFGQLDWHESVLRQLEHFDCVQTFDRLVSYHGPGYRTSIATAKDPKSLSAGGGWAATCEFWRRVELYQHCIVGGGDTMMAKVFLEFGQENPRIWSWRFSGPRMQGMNVDFREHVIAWARRSWGPWRVGCTDEVTAYLLPHGTRSNRQYGARHKILDDFRPLSDIKLGPQGAWQWSSCKPDLHQSIANYFLGRNEDEA